MKRIALVVASLVVTSVASAQSPSKEAVAKALAAIRGTWVITTFNGQSAADAGADIALTFTDAGYTQLVSGVVDERGTFKLDPSKTPWLIDLGITEGNDAGKPQVGLVEIKGDVMTCKFSVPGETTRPTSLAPEEGFIHVTAKRSK
jgi:uncharacterized protein (TIGR03067 family)